MQFIDLNSQREQLGTRLEVAIKKVLEHGRFILGPEVADFEDALSNYTGAPHVVSCANGTDALVLALRALGVRPGETVVVPSFTFAATAEAVALTGAVPVFADVDEATFNLSADTVRAAIDVAPSAVGVIAVDLFGHPAPYASVREVIGDRWLLADAAQSMGGRAEHSRVGTLAQMTTTSFFPAKPLGCYGDGGAVLTTDGDMAEVVRSLRVHGQGAGKYDSERIGYNSRLDTIQAAVLLLKLELLEDEMRRRQQIAARYGEALSDIVTVPKLRPDTRSAWAQYTVRVEDRDRVAAALADADIPTSVYYPRPLHLQAAYCGYPRASEALEASESLSGDVLSLPMHPYLTEADQQRVIEGVQRLVRK